MQPTIEPIQNETVLAEWSPKTSKADITVAKDGSGDYETVNEAVAALARMARNGKGISRRVIVYVKAGVYNEKVEIRNNLHNVMLVGDGIDKTVIASDRNVHDGATTFNSATIGT